MDGNQLEVVAETIVKSLHSKRVILFGSNARGHQREDSDLDLFGEIKSERRPPGREVEVSSIFGLRRRPLDVVVYTTSEVDRSRKANSILQCIIEADGGVLYERS
jgi:predicted nucleotidyltransferase